MDAFPDCFQSKLLSVGLSLRDAPVVDDRIHRFCTPPDKEADSWYVLHRSGNIVYGAFGCWRRGIRETFCSRDPKTMSAAEAQKFREQLRIQEVARKEEEKANQAKVQERALALQQSATKADETHPYLKRKGVRASAGVKVSNDPLYPNWLAVPMFDVSGKLQNTQFIAEDGTKRFYYQGRTQGCFHVIGKDNPHYPVVLCEGYATGCSLWMATTWQVIVAFSRGNLRHVAEAIHKQHPDWRIVIAGDNDQFTPGNPGLTDAKKAAQLIRCPCVYPEFSDEALAERPTDFNDLHRLSGLEPVQRAVCCAFPALEILFTREFNVHKQPPPMQVVYSLQDKVIGTVGNLSSVTSTVKTGKTSMLCAMMASAMPHDEDSDLLEFSSQNPDSLSLLHFDSEQCPDDHWRQIKNMLRRINRDEPPSWFHSYCLTGSSPKLAQECLSQALTIASDYSPGIHSVVLDGIADFVKDLNDDAESNEFIAQLMDWAIRFRFHLVGVIHFNPGTEKTRGHLGSQFERKAETNLQLDKTDGITMIWSEKQRRAAIPKFTGPSFYWNEELQMHTSTDSPTRARAPGGRKSVIEQIASMNTYSFLAGCPKEGESRTAISKRLEVWLAGERIEASSTTCYRAIGLLIQNGKLAKDSDGYYIKGPNA